MQEQIRLVRRRSGPTVVVRYAGLRTIMNYDEFFQRQLNDFMAGRLAYAAMTKAFKDVCRSNPQAAVRLHDNLQEVVNLGRLPPDLARLVEEACCRTVEPMTDVTDGLPTIPNDAVDGEATTPLAIEGPTADNPLHEKVDEVVLSALLSDYKEIRARRGGGSEAKAGRGRRKDAVDDLLSGYYGARLRHDAQRAQSGSGREFDLRKQGGARAGIGSLLNGRFVLDREIGRGGMGVVYAAVDRRRLEAGHSQPYVAIKTLSGDFARNSLAFRAFESEAR